MTRKNRNTIIRTALVVMLALVVCLVSGCSRKDEAAAPAAVTPELTAAPEITEAPAAEAGNEEVTEEMIAEAALAEEAADAEAAEAAEAPAKPVLLATVNGQEIWSNDDYLNAVIAYNEQSAESEGYDLSSPDVAEMLNQFAMHYTIQSTLLHQKAAELGYDKFTDEENKEFETEAKAEWASLVDSYASQSGLITDTSTDEEKVAARAQIEASFQAIGYDEARYVRETIEGHQESIMADRLMDHLTEGKTVTEEEVQKYYDDLVSEDKEQYENNIYMYEFYTGFPPYSLSHSSTSMVESSLAEYPHRFIASI